MLRFQKAFEMLYAVKPKVMTIAAAIRREIESPDRTTDRLDRVPALAARLGVSVNTVLAALGILESEGLIERKSGSGVYIKPRGTARKTVGILIEHDILHPRCSVFWTQLVRELRRYFSCHGIQSNLYLGEVPFGTPEPSHVTSRHFLHDLASGRIAGVMLICTHQTSDLNAALECARVPVVGDSSFVPHHVPENINALVEEGVRQLHRQGCRRIALLAWNTVGLVETFGRSMQKAGLPVKPGWVRDNLLPEWSGAGWEEFREIWAAYNEKPDGLLVMDDILFRDALRAIREMGVAVPERLRIVAHATRGSDIDYPESVVRLELDPAEKAQFMGEMMVRLLAGETVGQCRKTLAYRVVTARTSPVNPAGVKKTI